ncbi:unnamed protein product, partial [Staurois parvus]
KLYTWHNGVRQVAFSWQLQRTRLHCSRVQWWLAVFPVASHFASTLL